MEFIISDGKCLFICNSCRNGLWYRWEWCTQIRGGNNNCRHFLISAPAVIIQLLQKMETSKAEMHVRQRKSQTSLIEYQSFLLASKDLFTRQAPFVLQLLCCKHHRQPGWSEKLSAPSTLFTKGSPDFMSWPKAFQQLQLHVSRWDHCSGVKEIFSWHLQLL